MNRESLTVRPVRKLGKLDLLVVALVTLARYNQLEEPPHVLRGYEFVSSAAQHENGHGRWYERDLRCGVPSLVAEEGDRT